MELQNRAGMCNGKLRIGKQHTLMARGQFVRIVPKVGKWNDD